MSVVEAVPMVEARRWKERVKDAAHAAVRPVVRLLVRIGVGPDALTLSGFGLSLIAAVLFFSGEFRAAGLWAVAAGICDLLDGEVARESGRTSTFGSFMDSTLDRIGEAALLGGLAGYYLSHLVQLAEDPLLRLDEAARGLLPITWALAALTAVAALAGSFMVSYTRARAEGLGIECRGGWFERPERMVLLIIGAMFGIGPVMMAALLLLMILSWWTAGQRLFHVWRVTRVTAGR